MTCLGGILLALLIEFIVLGFYHLSVISKRDRRINALLQKPQDHTHPQDYIGRP